MAKLLQTNVYDELAKLFKVFPTFRPVTFPQRMTESINKSRKVFSGHFESEWNSQQDERSPRLSRWNKRRESEWDNDERTGGMTRSRPALIMDIKSFLKERRRSEWYCTSENLNSDEREYTSVKRGWCPCGGVRFNQVCSCMAKVTNTDGVESNFLLESVYFCTSEIKRCKQREIFLQTECGVARSRDWSSHSKKVLGYNHVMADVWFFLYARVY